MGGRGGVLRPFELSILISTGSPSGLLVPACCECGYSSDNSQGVLAVPFDLCCDIVAVRGWAGETVKSVSQHPQSLTDRAFFSPDGRDLAFRLPVRGSAVHGINRLACLGHRVAVLAVADLADGLTQMG